jgi:hypothetical protein
MTRIEGFDRLDVEVPHPLIQQRSISIHAIEKYDPNLRTERIFGRGVRWGDYWTGKSRPVDHPVEIPHPVFVP